MALSDADVQKQVKIAVKLWKFVDDEEVNFFLLKFAQIWWKIFEKNDKRWVEAQGLVQIAVWIVNREWNPRKFQWKMNFQNNLCLSKS